MLFKEKKNRKYNLLTRKTISPSPSFFIMLVLALGTHEWIKQPNDSHMFKLSESPTNMIFFPLNFSRNANPLNLQRTYHHYIKELLIKETVEIKLKKKFKNSYVLRTLGDYRRKVAICIWGIGCRVFCTSGSWIHRLWTDKLRNHRVGKMHRTPIFLWRYCSCLYLQQLQLAFCEQQ